MIGSWINILLPKKTVRVIIWLLISIAWFDVAGQPKSPIITGAAQLDVLLPKLKSQRVALLVNHTSKIGKTHLVDTLLKAGITIQKIL
ncbi:MAG: hypothetical protein ACKOQ2_30310, partial [Dolichospermum sp.]